MVTAKYVQPGMAVDFRNTTEEIIPQGSVVQIGDRIGIAGGDIQPGEVGALNVSGVFLFPKSGEDAIALGKNVYFSETGISGTAGAAGASGAVGYAVEAADASADSVLVRLCG